MVTETGRLGRLLDGKYVSFHTCCCLVFIESNPSSETCFVFIFCSSFFYNNLEGGEANHGNNFSGIVASCIRMACFFQIDAFGDRIDIYLWTVIEPGMYLAAVCFVRFRPIIALAGGKTHIKNICGSRSRSPSWV